jgi:hypothetical protein
MRQIGAIPMGLRGPKPKPPDLQRVPIPARLPRGRIAALRRAATRQNLTLTEFLNNLTAMVDDGRPYAAEPADDAAAVL